MSSSVRRCTRRSEETRCAKPSSVTRQTRAAVARGETLEKAQASVDLEEFRKKFAGDSKLRSSVFANYVAGPAVAAVFLEASPKPAKPTN